jgi:hypothetical protein
MTTCKNPEYEMIPTMGPPSMISFKTTPPPRVYKAIAITKTLKISLIANA